MWKLFIAGTRIRFNAIKVHVIAYITLVLDHLAILEREKKKIEITLIQLSNSAKHDFFSTLSQSASQSVSQSVGSRWFNAILYHKKHRL